MNAVSTENSVIIIILSAAIISMTSIRSFAQVASAGPFQLEQMSIATGGVTNATSGSFAVGGTTGQAAGGRSISAQSFTLYPGFWTPADLAPTAAHVTVGGRVLSPSGSPVYGARVSITDQEGNTQAALSNPFGYYQFDDVEVGRGYVLEAKHKTYQFNPIFVHLVDQIADLDLIAL
jgi:hypothetical protein